jgi:uncharacterized protein
MENNTGKTVLITGASSGIGYELARLFARDQYQLILVAHYAGKLREAANNLRQEFPDLRLDLIPADLSKPGAAAKIFTQLQEQGSEIDILVNNAGFGEYGLFSETDLEKETAMVHTNVIALMQLTKLFLPAMLNRRAGRILQLGSVASFMPAPLQAVYGATKAFILSFSEALQEELKDTSVTVTVLCPPATDTNFFRVAGAQNSKIAQGNLATPEEVALGGYQALMKGDARAVPTFKAKVEVAASNILPDSVLAASMHKQSEEVKPGKAMKKNTRKKESANTGPEPAAEVTANPENKPRRSRSTKKE